ncbi:MAG: SDR family oxidoreductase [Nitrospinae bacterium]|nr:SDR family oxidoreductase [Nitrospinota bacterium]
MENRFKNKIAVITGGGSGIGKEAAKALIAEGARVVINGRTQEKLEKAANEIDPSRENIRIVAGDIGLAETRRKLVEKAEKDFGGIDILLNNAGIFKPIRFLDHTEDDFDRFIGTILKGKFFLAQAVIPVMIKRGGGSIVHTGSLWAIDAVAATPSSAYSAANAGVHALVQNIAIEHAKDNIRINAVAPAVVETPVYDTFMTPKEVSEVLPTFNAFHPLGRNGQPMDIVNAILFLASPQASWITGTILPVDGGVLAGR